MLSCAMYIPHEGRCQLKLSPPIVGLMRNSLSEAMRGKECPRNYRLLFLLFSCQKYNARQGVPA